MRERGERPRSVLAGARTHMSVACVSMACTALVDVDDYEFVAGASAAGGAPAQVTGQLDGAGAVADGLGGSAPAAGAATGSPSSTSPGALPNGAAPALPSVAAAGPCALGSAVLGACTL